jgi:hypothetical protein
MQSVKHHQNVRGNSFVSMVTVSALQIPVGIIANMLTRLSPLLHNAPGLERGTKY